MPRSWSTTPCERAFLFCPFCVNHVLSPCPLAHPNAHTASPLERSGVSAERRKQWKRRRSSKKPLLESVAEQQVFSASIEGVFAWCGLVSSMCSPLEESVGAAETPLRRSTFAFRKLFLAIDTVTMESLMRTPARAPGATRACADRRPRRSDRTPNESPNGVTCEGAGVLREGVEHCTRKPVRSHCN